MGYLSLELFYTANLDSFISPTEELSYLPALCVVRSDDTKMLVLWIKELVLE